MTRNRKNTRRPQPQEQGPRNYRDSNVNFPSTLADNVSAIRYVNTLHPKLAAALGRVVSKQNRNRGGES